MDRNASALGSGQVAGTRADGSARTGRARSWLESLDRSPRTPWLLFSASFAETIIVPIPIELVLIPYMVTHRDRTWSAAAVVTAGCLTAALVGYGVGYLLFDTLGLWLVEALEWQAPLERFREMFEAHGFLAIVAIGVIPVPFQVAMLAAGAARYPVALFVLAATLARGLRYFGLALLVWRFGERAEELFRRHRRSSMIVLTLLFAILVAVALLR